MIVCPPWLSWTLINPLRRLTQDPEKILRPFIGEGDTALDVGCGPGYFTAALARLVGGSGRVIAIDIQEWMLERAGAQAAKANLAERVLLHRARPGGLSLAPGFADFALAFWMAHEVPDKEKLFAEIGAGLLPGGTLLLVEPRLHVSAKTFSGIVGAAVKSGFVPDRPVSIRLSRAVLLRKPASG